MANVMKILLVEDDSELANYVRKRLCEEGHQVMLATNGREGLISATTDTFDVIVLDRMLPSLDGLKLLQTLRATGDRTPVLILSALGDTDERVKGLRLGSDDYLAKPFALAELVARLEVLGRRTVSPMEESSIQVRDLRIDLLSRAAFRDEKRVELTDREFRILVYLARNAGRVVTRSMLLEAVWDYQFDPQTNIIDQHVSRLRNKLDAGSLPNLIVTVRGSGYMIERQA